MDKATRISLCYRFCMKVSNSLLLIISLSTLLLPRPASAVTLLFTSNIPDIFQDDKERGITNLAGYIETLKKEIENLKNNGKLVVIATNEKNEISWCDNIIQL